MQADIGPSGGAPSGGFFSSKKNLLLLAAVGGGAVGLVIFLSKRGATSGQTGGPAQYSAADLTNASLANQILQFRGEQSQANSDLSLQIKGGFDQTKTGTDALTGLINILTGNVSGLQEDVTGIGSNVVNVQQNQTLIQQMIENARNMIQQNINMTQNGLDLTQRGNNLTQQDINMSAQIIAQNAGTRDALAGLGGMVQGIGGQLVNINGGITGAGGQLNAINRTVATGLSSGDVALQGVNDRLSFIMRALSALGENQSLYGNASAVRSIRVPDAVGGLINPLTIGRIENGLGQRDIIGGSGAQPALTGAQDGGDGTMQNWLSTFYQLPTLRLPMVG